MATVNGTSGNDTLYGTSAADQIRGYAGNDNLRDYDGGNDTYIFHAGDGHDIISDYNAAGVAENDVLQFGPGITAADLVFEAVASGGLKISFRNAPDDSVLIQYHLYGDGRWDFRTLRFHDGSLLDISLESAAYTLQTTGTAGNDTLYSDHNGPDRMLGGAGQDSLSGGNGADDLQGQDGHDRLWGEEGHDLLSGGSGADSLYGGAGNDTLDGGDGDDDLWGGDGDDVYFVNSYGDRITDSAGQNTVRIAAGLDNYKVPAGMTAVYESADTLRLPYFLDALASGASWSVTGLGAVVDFSFVESSDLAGFQTYSAAQKTLVRSILAEYAAVSGLVFTEVADTASVRIRLFQDGGPAASGAAGYAYYPDGGDVHIDPGYADNYHVLFHEIGHAVGLRHPGNYGGNGSGPFLPAAEDNTDNTQMSYSGYGEGGNYFRIFDLAAVHYLYGVNSAARSGNDTYTLADRYIWDGAGNDTLSLATATGALTVDLRDGAWGWEGSQADSILAAGQFFIGAGTVIENVVGGSGADSLRGNESDNRLDGGAGNDRLYGLTGNDTLSGGTGKDTMAGGTGNDTYTVSESGDVIQELAQEGTDTVYSALSWTLGANLENLVLTGTAGVRATGNALANTLTGNGGKNVLDGGAGADTLIGGAGDNTYYVDHAGDTVIELTGGGVDVVHASLSHVLAFGVNDLVLTGTADLSGTGNDYANKIRGNDGRNTLNGGAGKDTLTGGLGDDTYVVDALDSVVELAGQGVDTVLSALGATLAAHVENLTLTGSGHVQATGNGLANTLTGNGGKNILNGLGGADTLIGGAGDDVYYVDDAGDTVIERVNGGWDMVYASVSHTLANQVNDLTLTGTADLAGGGNTYSNKLYGNSGANVLTGGKGNDSLEGGLGNDTYVLRRGHGADVITENDATAGNRDLLWFDDVLVSHDKLWFRQVGNDLEVAVIGTADKATVKNWYTGADSRVEQIRAGDGKMLEAVEVAALVSAMAAFGTRPGGGTSLTATELATLTPVLAANWS